MVYCGSIGSVPAGQNLRKACPCCNATAITASLHGAFVVVGLTIATIISIAGFAASYSSKGFRQRSRTVDRGCILMHLKDDHSLWDC